MKPPSWCIFLRSLPVGGVARQFTTLANYLSASRRVAVVTMFSHQHDPLPTNELVERYSLYADEDTNSTPAKMLVGASERLRRLCREQDFNVIYSARELANWVAARAVLREPERLLLWGHRVSHHQFSWKIKTILHLSRLVRSRVNCEISNSHRGLDAYRELGLCQGQTLFLPNFIDSNLFQPNSGQRAVVRESWGLSDDTPIIAIVGRFAPMKNHAGFLRAAAIVAEANDQARFIMIGPNAQQAKSELAEQANSLGISERLMFLDQAPAKEMPGVLSAIDILCSSSSFGEGFSNVLAEAMACGCQIVATDVGESAAIVGDHGVVTTPQDDKQLAEGLLRTLAIPRHEDIDARRQHVIDLCDPQKILEQLMALERAFFQK